MNVSLTPELQKMVAERVDSGRYASASEVIREALRLLEDRDRLAVLRRDVAAGIDQLDQGRGRVLDKTTIARIKRSGRQRLVPRSEARGKTR